jgi:hypothetical protein
MSPCRPAYSLRAGGKEDSDERFPSAAIRDHLRFGHRARGWPAQPALTASDNPKVGLQLRVTLAPELQTGDLTGRLIVVASTESGDDQLSTIVDFPDVQPFFAPVP